MNKEILEETLNGFSERGYHVGLYTILSQSIHKQRRFKDDISDDELIMLCVLILTFLSEADYADYPVTQKEIEALLKEVFEKLYETSLSDEMAKELCEFLMISVLQNEGNPFSFRSLDFEKGGTKKEEYRFIKEEKKEINGVRKEVYVLLNQGRQLLYGTKEIQDSYEVNLEEMRISYLISKRRFSQANVAAMEACKIAKNNISEMQQFIKKTNRGFTLALEREFNAVYDQALSSLREKKEFSEGLKAQIELIYEEIKAGVSNEERLKNLEEVVEVQKTLSRLLSLHQRMLTTMLKLNKAYDEAIVNYELFEMKGLNFEKDVLKVVEDHPYAIFNTFDLFRTLGKPQFKPVVNPLVFYSEQHSLKGRTFSDKTPAVSLVGEAVENSFLIEQQLKRQTQREEMKQICRALLNELERTNGELELKVWIAQLEEDDSETTVSWFGKETFRYVLATLFSKDQTIDINRLKKMRSKFQLLSDVVDFELALAELSEEIPYLETINHLYIQQTENPKDVFEYAYQVKENDLYSHYEVTLNNFIIKGEWRSNES